MGEETYTNLAIDTAESLRLFSENLQGTPFESPFGIPFGVGSMEIGDLDVRTEIKKVLDLGEMLIKSEGNLLENKEIGPSNDYSYSDLADPNRVKSLSGESIVSQLSDVNTDLDQNLEIINRFWTKSKNEFGGQNGISIDMHEVVITKHPKTLNKSYSFESNMIAGRLQLLIDSMFINRETTLVEAEQKAQKKLLDLLSEKQRISFIVNDSFYEIGKSGVRYIFRRNRPTLALRLSAPEDGKQRVKFLAALCCHPMGYYVGTFAGVMAPSDELITNLGLLRADEHGFWKRSNQHPIHDPRSGV